MDFLSLPNCAEARGYRLYRVLPQLLLITYLPVTQQPTMEKVTLQNHYEALSQDPENLKISKPKSCRKRGWALLLCSVLAGGWILRPHCHHVHRVPTIEERVHHILTQTPLIGIDNRTILAKYG